MSVGSEREEDVCVQGEREEDVVWGVRGRRMCVCRVRERKGREEGMGRVREQRVCRGKRVQKVRKDVRSVGGRPTAYMCHSFCSSHCCSSVCSYLQGRPLFLV